MNLYHPNSVAGPFKAEIEAQQIVDDTNLKQACGFGTLSIWRF